MTAQAKFRACEAPGELQQPYSEEGSLKGQAAGQLLEGSSCTAEAARGRKGRAAEADEKLLVEGGRVAVYGHSLVSPGCCLEPAVLLGRVLKVFWQLDNLT